MPARWSMVLAAVAAIEIAALSSAGSQSKVALDYDFYKSRVEPIFLKKKAGTHAAWSATPTPATPSAWKSIRPTARHGPTKNRARISKRFRSWSIPVPDCQPSADASARARRRRQRLSFRRAAVRVGQRYRLEDHSPVDQWNEARRPVEEELAAGCGLSGTTIVPMRLGTSPTLITALTFMPGTSFAVTVRCAAFDT